MGTIAIKWLERSMGTMVNTDWRDRWLRWSIQAGEIAGYDGQYRLERSMATMVNTCWRDRLVRWSIQAGERSIQAGEIDGYDAQYRL